MTVGKNTVILDADGNTVANPTAADGKFSYKVLASDFATAPADVAFAESIGVTVNSGVTATYYVGDKATVITGSGSAVNIPAGTKLALTATGTTDDQMWQFKTTTGKIGDRVTGSASVEYIVPASGTVTISVDEILAIYAGPGVTISYNDGAAQEIKGGSYGTTVYMTKTAAAAATTWACVGTVYAEKAVVKPAGVSAASLSGAGFSDMLTGSVPTTHISVYKVNQVTLTGTTAKLGNTPVNSNDYVSVGAVLNLTGGVATYGYTIKVTETAGGAEITQIGMADNAVKATGTYTMPDKAVTIADAKTDKYETQSYSLTLPAGVVAKVNGSALDAAGLAAITEGTVVTLETSGGDPVFGDNWYTKTAASTYESGASKNTITMNANKDLSAMELDKYYKVVMNASATTGASVPAGLTLTITVPADSYVKSGETVNVTLAATGTCSAATSNALTLVLSTPAATNSANYSSAVNVVDTGGTTVAGTFQTTDTVTISSPATATVELQYTLAGG